MRIEIISGSPRTASTTHRVALHLKNYLLQNTEHAVDVIDMREWDVVSSEYVEPDAKNEFPMRFDVLLRKE